jgi:hypothetical protein
MKYDPAVLQTIVSLSLCLLSHFTTYHYLPPNYTRFLQNTEIYAIKASGAFRVDDTRRCRTLSAIQELSS